MSHIDTAVQVCNALHMRKLEASDWEAFLHWIEAEGERRGLDTKQIAESAGVSPSTIWRVGQPDRGMRLELAIAIADALGVPFAQLAAVIDAARAGEAAPPHPAWPVLADAIAHAPDITSDSERLDILRAIDLVRSVRREEAGERSLRPEVRKRARRK